MKTIKYILFSSVLLVLNSCISQFIPETTENQELLVVEGLITDQPGINTIKLSKSMPLGIKSAAIPLTRCTVWISDDTQNSYSLSETAAGTYVTNPLQFRGSTGRKYTLHIKTNNSFTNNYSFESFPMEMRSVPLIDSIYYEKKIIRPKDGLGSDAEGCQVYLNTHDPEAACKFFRWDYTETWEFRLPFSKAINDVCWISNNSGVINIKNTSSLAETVIDRYPLKFITNETDRLKVKFSMLVNQYSLNEDEFVYWEKLQKITQDVGSLYDITPAAIPGNIYCIENPAEKVLGYFSVSAKSSKRIFIKDNFKRIVNLYSDCISATILGNNPVIPNLNLTVWILEQSIGPGVVAPFTAITYSKGCADCTVRGTKIEPVFWKDNN